MEKTIKYLENGEYHYATVKDVGDLAKLKTDSKDDLVTAINELFITGGEASKKPDGYDELVDNVADAIQKQQQMTDTITNMQQSAQLSDAEMQHMKQVQEEAHQDYIKALKEFNDAIAQANADALELDKKTDELKKNADDLNKKTNDLQDKLNETFTNVGNEVSAVHKQLDTESAGLHKELNDTKTSLEATRKDLLNNTQEFGVVNSEVKELKDKMDRRIWSTDLDPVREQVNKNTTEVSQTKDELKNKADQSNLDLVTNSVENLSTQVKENAAGLKVSVKKDELGGDVARLLNDKTNLLLGTRNFSGDSWGNKTFWHEEAGYWKGLKVFSSTEIWFGLQYKYEVKQGQQYTFSFWARQEKDNSSASIVLSESDKGDQGITTPYNEWIHIGTEWKRYSLTFQAESDGIIYPRVEQSVQGNKLYIAGYKLELGNVATPWEPNEADVAENIEHNESQFNIFNDQITGIVKKQEKMGDTERQLDTRITENAEGLKQTSKDLQDANGKITEFKGQLESTARGLKTEYEKYTNDAIGQISDSSLNLIRNSAFQNKDDSFAQWQNVSAKANIREDSNGLRWVEITQSGMTTSNPQGITSNYFNVKQGKVTVAVDIKSGDKAELDNESVLFLELYDNAKKRVDFHWVTLAELGLNKNLLNDHQVHRGLYRLAIDRTDAQYMTVKAHLIRNGDLWFTNFSARLSSIDDGGYTPNPDDLNQQILKMNTKIEEDAEHIALKANSVDVTRDIKSAVDGVQVGGTNLLRGTSSEAISGDAPTTGWKDMGSIYNTSGPLNEKQYVLSFDARGDVDKQIIQTFLWAESLGGHNIVTSSVTSQGDKYYSVDGNSHFTLTTQWTRYWVIYNVSPDNTRKQVIVGRRQAQASGKTASGKVYIKSVKLEEGNKSTSWSPAPEDTSAEIKSAKEAAIKVSSDQIDLHVNELTTSFDDKLNKRVNEVKTASEKFTSDGIEQTVKKITDVKNQVDGVNNKVDNLKVGTSNLLHHSDTFEGWNKYATSSISKEKYLNGNVVVLSPSKVGADGIDAKLDGPYDNQTLTWTVYAKADNAGDKLHTELWGGGGFTNQPLTTEWKLYQFTGHRDSRNNGFYLWGCQSNKGKVYIALPFAVVGSTIGTWSPNPEDVDSKFQYKEVTGAIDFNDLKAQQKIFYKDVHAQNAPAGSNYWYFLDVDVVPGTARIVQTATSDRNNITWKRTFADSWTAWQKQATQGDVDALRTETTASVKNLGDRVTTEVNSITSRVDNLKAGGQNLVADGDASAYGATPWENTTFRTHPFYYNSTKLMFVIDTSAKTELTAGCPNWFPVKAGQQYTLYFNGFMSNNVSSYDVWLLGKKADAQGGWTDSYPIIAGERLDPSHNCIVTRTFTVPSSWNNYVAYIRFDNNGSTDGHSAVFFFNEVSLKEGNINTGYSPAPENTVNEIKKLNTKWDVANGQIQGKVTATDVNNILNGKGYATQSWAQSQFRMKSDSIDLEVKKITDPISNKINNLQVGGRNLLANSSNDISVTSHTTDGYPAWANIDTGFSFEHGKTYTFSTEAKNSTSKIAEASIRVFEYSTNTQVGIYAFPADGKRHSVTFTVPNDSHDYHLLLYAGHAGIIPGVDVTTTYHHPKLEEGNVATDWTPAPEDVSEEIKSAKDAAIKVASDQIDIHVNELRTSFDDKLNNQINESKSASQKFTSDSIEQTVRKITDVRNQVDGINSKVNNLQIGGRNIARNTDRDIVIDDTGNTGAQGWRYAKIHLTQQPKIGDQVTVSAEGTLSGKGNLGTYDVILYNSTTSNARSNSERLSSGKRASATLQVNNLDGNGDTVLLIYAGNISDTEGKKNTVHHLKVEFGNVATDWTPAPEDINQKIDTQTLDSANIDEMKTQGHYFVKSLTGNPLGSGWVYVDVIGNNSDRIRQDVYQDNGNKHMYRRLFGTAWSPWEQGAYLSDVNNVRTEVTASVKNLGDRVTTEVNSITSKINSNNGGGINLVKKSSFHNIILSQLSPTWAISPRVSIDNGTIKNGAIKIDSQGSSSLSEIQQPISVDPDTDYTFSMHLIWGKADKNFHAHIFMVEYGDDGKTISPYADHSHDIANNAARSANTYTIHTSKNTHSIRLYIRAEAGSMIELEEVKLERGSIATPWSPSPADTDAAIESINTKLDVANGQIQGKVTATDVNNILNGKGYATQSWAQTMFTMKSDAITLQAVRDNITNGIQNQINDTRNQVKGLQNQFNTQTGINLLKGTADFSGSWFNKDANGWSIMSGWQAPFSENTSAMNNNVVYVKNGSAWNGLGQAVQLNPGEYTFSMWLWPDLSGKESLSIYAGDGQYGGTATLSCGYTYSASQPQKQWVLAKLYLNVTKGGVVAIRPELNQDTGKMYVASYMLQRGHVENPTWAPNPGDLSPSNIVSAINLTPDDIKLASKKINIDGNTSISGTLNVPTVRLQGKSGQIDLSGDSGISIKDSSDSKVDIGASGVNIFSGMQTVNTDFADKSGFKLNVGSSGVEFSNVLHQTNGIMGAGQHEYGFLKIEPAVLPGTNTQETQYNAPAGIIGYVENMPDASLGPMSPGGFLALGSRTRKDTNVNSPVEDKTEIVYANKALNGWDQGLTIRSQFFIKPQDADHGIRSAWVSWSAWDHGEKYPAFVNDSGAWGGICFPRSGRVTLFDSGGQYYTPDRSTGVGPYDNYWTKGQ